jgi:hypothetical protein
LADDELRSQVAAFTSGDAWVVDGNHFDLVTRDLVWPRADTVVWLDLPRPVLMRRLLRRAVRNVLRRDHRDVLRSAWTTHAEQQERYETGLIGLGATLARLRSSGAVRNFVKAVESDAATRSRRT